MTLGSTSRQIDKRKEADLYVENSKLKVIAESDCMKRLLNQIQGFAKSNSTILISGETGTGKEILARFSHECSARAKAPFIAINCAALPEDLLESELFGHRRGAFTGATENREGLIVRADGGTLFLDEIADMSLAIQAKLLRVIQERKLRPLGEFKEIPVNIRIICASHRKLIEAVSDHSFRQDLYFRLSVLPLHVPPLRSRTEDILPLARYFITQGCIQAQTPMKKLTKESEEKLLSYDWPGNVRELGNVIERTLVYAQEHLILPDHICFDCEPIEKENKLKASDIFEDLDLKGLERKAISYALKASNGIKIQAARRLGIDRKTLLRKEKEYGLGWKSNPGFSS